MNIRSEYQSRASRGYHMSINDNEKEGPGIENRRDYVGRSGVYPMSGPHPSGDAPIRGQMGWGLGERGSVGYEDHGSSELLFHDNALVGGLDPEWAKTFEESLTESPAVERNIPLVCWPLFCDWFTSHYSGMHTSIVITDRDSQTTCEARNLPLVRLTAALLANQVASISVQLDRKPSDYLLNVTTPRQVTYIRNPNGLPGTIRIEEEQGSILLSFEHVRLANDP